MVSITSTYYTTFVSTATTVAPPQATCTPNAALVPPLPDWSPTGKGHAACGVMLYTTGYSVENATDAIRHCCGKQPILYYNSGCGLFCHTSTNGDTSDYSALGTCLRETLGTYVCGSVLPGGSSPDVSSSTLIGSATTSSPSATSAASSSKAATGIQGEVGSMAGMLDAVMLVVRLVIRMVL